MSETSPNTDRRKKTIERLIRYSVGTLVLGALFYLWFGMLSPCAPRKHAAEFDMLAQAENRWARAFETAENETELLDSLRQVRTETAGLPISECLDTEYDRFIDQMNVVITRLEEQSGTE
jgi:hypothetical protein